MPSAEERLATLEEKMDTLTAAVEKNAELTQDIYGMVRGFKIFAGLARYIGYLAAAYVALREAIRAYGGLK